jgi:TPP-dependent pyruvate/acetoin dehydrogenase alpha subunit
LLRDTHTIIMRQAPEATPDTKSRLPLAGRTPPTRACTCVWTKPSAAARNAWQRPVRPSRRDPRPSTDQSRLSIDTALIAILFCIKMNYESTFKNWEAPVAAGQSKPSSAELLRLYAGMRLIREVEQRLSWLFGEGEIPGFIHLSIGQEAVAVGVAGALKTDDTLASNHRGHGHAIAKGLDLSRFFLEIMGRSEGYCGGRGGSMHVADMSVGMLGANGIVGAGLPIAVGSALAHQLRKTGAIACVFFGDGALAEGVLHESFNMAALWKLPILFVCENNGWSEFSPAARQLATEPLKLAETFRIPADRVDGNDVIAVRAAALAAIEAVRTGNGPRLVECKTTRVRGHFEGDPQKYRDAGEFDEIGRKDPLARAAGELRAMGVSDADIAAIDEAARRRVDQAVAAARAGSAPVPETALADVYSPARADAAA